ncbi:MAG TPA: NAD-dependent epimerase/dehydratase family protein, partial [Blastocatellia bacterium]|nr:NAD-dependent epimerase/dehydratase family protein [Blastocatellia bacterium]
MPHSPFTIPHSLSMRAFITGATGFIGAHLARELLRDGHQVKALVRQESDRRNVAGLPVEMVEGDLDDRRRLAE